MAFSCNAGPYSYRLLTNLRIGMPYVKVPPMGSVTVTGPDGRYSVFKAYNSVWPTLQVSPYSGHMYMRLVDLTIAIDILFFYIHS